MTKHFFKQNLMIVLYSLIAAKTFSQTPPHPPVTNTTQASVAKVTALEKKFSLSTSIEYSQKVEVEQNAERERGTDVTFVTAYKLNDLYSFLGKVGLSKELNGPQNTTVSDTTGSFVVKGVQLNKEWITTHSLSLVLPTSANSQTRDRLRTSIGLSHGLTYATDSIVAKYKLSVSKNFHEFSQNADGAFLNEYRLTNSVEAILPVTEKLSVSASSLYRISFTYENDQKYGFGFDADLNYEFNQKLSANIGFSNEGNALKANGTDSNVNIYDEATSVTRAGLTYIY